MSDLRLVGYERQMEEYWLENSDLRLWQCRELTKEVGWENEIVAKKKAERTEFHKLSRLAVCIIYCAEFISFFKKVFRP